MSVSLLVADDNGADIEIISLACEELDLDVDIHVARDGRQAIALLAGERPDLLLLDIKMPGADGFDVLAQLRSEERLRDLPIIIMSSSMSPVDQRRAMRLGANRYWVKPSLFSEALDFVASLGLPQRAGSSPG